MTTDPELMIKLDAILEALGRIEVALAKPAYKPRGDRDDGGYKKPFRPREDREGGFKKPFRPRGDRGDRDDRGGWGRPRDEGDDRPRRGPPRDRNVEDRPRRGPPREDGMGRDRRGFPKPAFKGKKDFGGPKKSFGGPKGGAPRKPRKSYDD